jgi:hypothetical protein
LKESVLGYKSNFNSNLHSLTLGVSHEYNSENNKFTNAFSTKFYLYDLSTKLIKITDLNKLPNSIENSKTDMGFTNALRYRFSSNFLIKASFAYDIRLPNSSELLGDGLIISPAGNLDPERSLATNLGFMYDRRQNDSRLQIELNVFQQYLKDMIFFSGGPLQSMYENFGEMKSLGLEFELKSDITNWLYLWSNFTYQDLRDANKNQPNSTAKNPTYNDRIPHIPFLLANGGFEIHKENMFGGKGHNSRFFADLRFVEEYFYDFEQSDYQEFKIPRSTIINAGIEHSFKNKTIYLSAQINNIMDKEALSEFNRPLKGRNFGFKIRYVWKDYNPR